MSGGRLRDVVTVQRLDETGDDGAGNVKRAWINLLEAIPAEIKPDRTKERVSTMGEAAITTFTIRMRWHPDMQSVTTKDSLVDARSQRVFKLVGIPINRDLRQRYLDVSAVLTD